MTSLARATPALAAPKATQPRPARLSSLTCRAVATPIFKRPAPQDGLDKLIANNFEHPPSQRDRKWGESVPLFSGANAEARLQALRSLLDYSAHNDVEQPGPPPALQLAMRQLEMRIVEKLEKHVSAAWELEQLQQLVNVARFTEDEARD